MPNERFTIRPKIIQGESLTSYLSRVALRNCISPLQMLKLIEFKNVRNVKLGYSIDLYPGLVSNLKRIENLTDQAICELELMTFWPLIRKFCQVTKGQWSIIREVTEKRFLKYCSLCLQETGTFKLLWQVSEIQICNIHRVKLLHSCPECNKEINYSLVHPPFCSCKSRIRKGKSEKCDVTLTKKQLLIYEEWEYLVDPKTTISPKIKGLNSQRAMAIGLLYLNSTNEYKITSTNYSISLRNIAIGEKGKYVITMKKFLDILRKAGLTPEQFSNLEIPLYFIRDTLVARKNINMSCLTPWCKSFGSADQMKRISHLDCFKNNKLKFSQPSICLDCGIKYGVGTHDGLWQSIDDFFTLSEKIKELMLDGKSRRQIRSIVGIGDFLLNRVVGYLAFHRLIPNEVIRKLKLEVCPKDIVSYFKKIVECATDKRIGFFSSAHKLFGWTSLEYYYYYCHPEVQRFLFLFPNRHIRNKNIAKLHED
ncbi:TniQ family protein [Desulfitobacterium sp.]|uniref:TniQ family protein n=1 Tax=Desulfitobacterium sp. TaxID=49981 RepID=UPI002B200676|nr:TniQ family protein [Desulfitobacterium sp.]MEA4900709.1 TniQ family protein [Desulfitobacterium sp.]